MMQQRRQLRCAIYDHVFFFSRLMSTFFLRLTSTCLQTRSAATTLIVMDHTATKIAHGKKFARDAIRGLIYGSAGTSIMHSANESEEEKL